MRVRDARRKYGKKAVTGFPVKVRCPIKLQRQIARSAARYVVGKREARRQVWTVMRAVFRFWRTVNLTHGRSGYRDRLFRRVS